MENVTRDDFIVWKGLDFTLFSLDFFLTLLNARQITLLYFQVLEIALWILALEIIVKPHYFKKFWCKGREFLRNTKVDQNFKRVGSSIIEFGFKDESYKVKIKYF